MNFSNLITYLIKVVKRVPIALSATLILRLITLILTTLPGSDDNAQGQQGERDEGVEEEGEEQSGRKEVSHEEDGRGGSRRRPRELRRTRDADNNGDVHINDIDNGDDDTGDEEDITSHATNIVMT